MTHVPPGRLPIVDQAVLKLIVIFKRDDGRLEHWRTFDAQQRLQAIRQLDSDIYEATPVINVFANHLHTAAAKHIAQYWPQFVDAWEKQKKGGPGNLAWEIMRNHLLNYIHAI
jgi:hypothetical protein